MSPCKEFRDEAVAMWLAAVSATAPDDREAYEVMAIAYEALAKNSEINALVAAGWMEVFAISDSGASPVR